jgi:hypothetical protein
MTPPRNLLAILVLTLAASGCSMLSGSKSSVGASNRGGGIADSYSSVKEMPVSLQNMKGLGARIDKNLSTIEAGVGDGTLGSPGRELVPNRTNLISYYGYGQKGGSEDCESCKNHPAFSGLRDDYDRLDKRQRALEEKYLKCTYGYKMSNGDILRPTFEWSPEEWAKIREKSTHKTPRCWMTENPEQYYRN